MLYFVTENKEKFQNATIILSEFNIQLENKSLPLIEIQSDSLEEIAKDKARQAFSLVKQPLIVKDDGWYITALKGFPGSYMKSVNGWFSPDDFLHLIEPYTNREIVFKDSLCYTDGKQEKIFTNTIRGEIVRTPKGKGVPSAMISSFRKDGKTMAQCINEGIHFANDGESIWYQFATWYQH